MRFKMAYDAVTLTIFFESSKNGSFILRMALASIVYYQHVCVSGSNYIHMHIGFEWVLWIHLHKELWFIAANNRVPQKLQLDLVAVRLIHYSRDGIFYYWMKREIHALTWTMGKGFVDLYFERHLRPELSLTNGIVKGRNLDHMGVFMLTSSCRNIIIWYL